MLAAVVHIGRFDTISSKYTRNINILEEAPQFSLQVLFIEEHSPSLMSFAPETTEAKL